MLYEFSTIQAAESEDHALSAESLSYDGKYLEKEVPGFRILTVSGRGILVKEITERTRNGFDGSDFVRRVIPARDITVQYSLSAPDAKELMARINQLNGLLSKDQAKIIFADEPDKYFVGTAYNATDLEPGRLSCTGEISIHCADPYKYSVVERPFYIPAGVRQRGTVEIENTGNADALLRYELQTSKDNGYIGISSAYGGLEFGNVEAARTKTVNDAQEWLIRSDAILKNWNCKSGEKHSVICRNHALDPMDDQSKADAGSRKFISLNHAEESIHRWTLVLPEHHTSLNNWCGCTFDVPVPPDSVQKAAGQTTGGATSFYAYFFHWFEAAFADECGEQTISFLNVAGSTTKEIASIHLHKNSITNGAETHVYIGGKEVRAFPFSCDHKNPYARGQYGNDDFHKDGAHFRYHFAGNYYGHTDESLKSVQCNVVRFTFMHFPGRPYLTRNYLGAFDFRKDHISGQSAIPVAFPAGTKLTIDGRYGKFLFNGMHKPEYEVIGSKYFMLPPGKHRVNFSTSKWFTGSLTGVIYVQERWL